MMLLPAPLPLLTVHVVFASCSILPKRIGLEEIDNFELAVGEEVLDLLIADRIFTGGVTIADGVPFTFVGNECDEQLEDEDEDEEDDEEQEEDEKEEDEEEDDDDNVDDTEVDTDFMIFALVIVVSFLL